MSIYGSRQKPTTRKKVSLSSSQGEAVSSNQANLESIKDLAASASAADTENLMNEMEKVFPGFKDMSGRASQVIGNYLKGDVGQDFADEMANRAASRNINTGTAGSQFAGFRELRNYGTTKMQMQQQGVQMMQQQTQLAKSMVNPMKASSLFVTPSQTYQAALAESDRDAQLMSHNNALAAMPDPGAVAAQEQARMRQVAGIQTQNAVAMSNASNYSWGHRMPYQMRPASKRMSDIRRLYG